MNDKISIGEMWTNRAKLPLILNALGLTGVGVEVGTFRGGFANQILETWKGTELHCVDPWRHISDGYTDTSNLSNEMFESAYRETDALLRKYAPRYKLVRSLSLDAVGSYSAGSLDFVYVDANHSREAVLSDMNAWFSKIKSGGVFAGHDYVSDGMHNGSLFGVMGAVKEFRDARDVGPLFVTSAPAETFASWLFVVK